MIYETDHLILGLPPREERMVIFPPSHLVLEKKIDPADPWFAPAVRPQDVLRRLNAMGYRTLEYSYERPGETPNYGVSVYVDGCWFYPLWGAPRSLAVAALLDALKDYYRDRDPDWYDRFYNGWFGRRLR